MALVFTKSVYLPSLILRRSVFLRYSPTYWHNNLKFTVTPSQNIHTHIRTFARIQENSPIQFSASKAAAWTSSDSFGPLPNSSPPLQAYSVILSTAALLIYFCILREENDIDNELNTTLYERLPGLEEQQLKLRILHNEKNSLDNTELKKRLSELESLREK